jgi:hypothetical protein
MMDVQFSNEVGLKQEQLKWLADGRRFGFSLSHQQFSKELYKDSLSHSHSRKLFETKKLLEKSI